MSLIVAVSGHRPNRLSASHDKLISQCRKVLAVIKGDVPEGDPTPVALSALAEGADRIFAEAALAEGFRLEAVFPFEEDDYRSTFMSPRSDEFYTLKDKASNIHMMNGDIEHAEDGYHELVKLLVEKCNILIAIWDGEPAAGPGGTPHVIELARAAGKPVVWIRADGKKALHIMTSDHVADIEIDEIARFI